ncbi:hypothetical protein KY338_03100 [Candidatus Woesearchaeota archaeon]|nr:hypothetical protein [Candidatus Woesearchaeota archaeon]MBW3005660.1 hypothetical protein [Candidatus Woesearchaeota archaeon]
MARKKLINKKMLVSLFIIAIMVLSAFGFMLSYQTNQAEKLDEYNGYSFKKTTQGFMTEINDQKIYFDYYPGDLDQINVSEDAKAILSQAEVLLITYDPSSDFAESIAELELDMEQKTQKIGKPFIAAGLTNATDYALPQITCSNATAEMPVLHMKRGKTSEITAQNNCVIIAAETESVLNAYYTRAAYLIFGVMK